MHAERKVYLDKKKYFGIRFNPYSFRMSVLWAACCKVAYLHTLTQTSEGMKMPGWGNVCPGFVCGSGKCLWTVGESSLYRANASLLLCCLKHCLSCPILMKRAGILFQWWSRAGEQALVGHCGLLSRPSWTFLGACLSLSFLPVKWSSETTFTSSRQAALWLLTSSESPP